MLKRLLVIGFFTGLGQLASLFSIKYITKYASFSQIASIGAIDSYYQLLLSLIALGLQSAAIRDIALVNQWKERFEEVQKARITFSMLLFPIGVAGIIDPVFYIFFLSPLLALNGDYALYATGQAIQGSMVACVRSVLPYALIVVFMFYTNQNMNFTYLLGTAAAYLFTNIYISKRLQMKVIFIPSIKYLSLYVKTIPLGIINLGLYMLGLGIVLILPYLLPSSTIATVFVGLKLYVIVKGVLRIIHQAFVREMQNTIVCLKVDQLSILITLTVFAAFTIFPVSTIKLFFGEQYVKERLFFQLLSIAGVLYSFNLSSTTRALLMRKDKNYTILTAASALIAILLTVLLSIQIAQPISVALSLLIAELVFCVGLLWLMGDSHLPGPRLAFLLKCVLSLIPVYFIRKLTYDSWWVNAGSLTVFISIIFAVNKGWFLESLSSSKLNSR